MSLTSVSVINDDHPNIAGEVETRQKLLLSADRCCPAQIAACHWLPIFDKLIKRSDMRYE